MTQRRLGLILGGGIALVALLALLTIAPIGPVTKATQDVSTTAVGAVDPILVGPQQDCLDVTFNIQVSYSESQPWLDVWGFKRIDDVSLDHGELSVAARADCADLVEAVSATAYFYAPACEAALCVGDYLTYATDSAEGTQASTLKFDGPQSLPGSGLVRGDWCLDFGADAGYSRVNGAAASDNARVTASDLCLDPS